MIKRDEICPVPCKDKTGLGALEPFFVIEFSVEEGEQSPAKVAEDLRRYREKEKGIYAGAFIFEFADDELPPWEQPAAKTWAKAFVDEHSDALAYLIDEAELMQRGFPISDFPFVGRLRMLALAGLAKFVPRPSSKGADETVDIHMSAEGEAMLRAFRGEAVEG
jgi:hypothetical protein